MAVGMYFHVRQGAKTTPVFYLLLDDTSKFGLFTIRWHSATRKQLFLYPQGDRSFWQIQKKDKHQH